MLELKIPRVCSLYFDESKGWTFARVAMFAKGFKKAILSEVETLDTEMPKDFERGYAFADKCRHFCEINGIDLINLKRAGIYTNGSSANDNEVHRIPGRKNLVEARFTVYQRA